MREHFDNPTTWERIERAVTPWLMAAATIIGASGLAISLYDGLRRCQ